MELIGSAVSQNWQSHMLFEVFRRITSNSG